MKVTNQKPVVLSPTFHDSISKDFDVFELLKSVVATPLYNPLITTTPVTIASKSQTITEDDITNTVISCCRDVMDVTAETFMKTLFRQTLVNFDEKSNIGINEAFVIQSACAAILPEPSDVVIYTPAQDVIPTARQFLGGQCDYDTYFASLAYYARPDTLGFYFANEMCFDNFKTWVSNQMSMLGNVLPAETNKLMADFQTLSLAGLTESLLLRNNDGENTDPYCFARLIIEQLMIYAQNVSPAEFGILPFTISELICPKTVVFVNVERHSRASAREVSQEWKLINNSINQKPAMISNKALTKLTATQRTLQKMASAAAVAAQNGGMPAARSANIRFSKTKPTTVNLARIIKKIIDKMAFVNKSLNTYKSVKTSYARPNRRNPDDFNKPGKITNTKYKPDIHLYIDTSGSISERDYQDAVKACIKMAKSMNIDVYFNSFSHCLSQTTKLNLKDKSVAQIYKEFQKVPKVSGGTEYDQIWHFINSSKKRTREISIVITDFGYTAPTRYIKHPKNIYYIPCSNQDYQYMCRWAEDFIKSMYHNDAAIRKHVLF